MCIIGSGSASSSLSIACSQRAQQLLSMFYLHIIAVKLVSQSVLRSVWLDVKLVSICSKTGSCCTESFRTN
jgi:hypothetical protein